MRFGARIACSLGALICLFAAQGQAEVGFAPASCQQAALASLAVQLPLESSKPPRESRIAIIIDDVGYSLAHGRTAAALPGAVTLSVLPHSPHAQVLSELAEQQGKEIMLHAPMSNLADTALDEGGLTESMDRRAFVAQLRRNLEALPVARGLNNHMGSRLTQNRRAMQWLMAELRSRDLYFVDSRTSSLSVAEQVAREVALPALSRDIFLDNHRNCEQIGRQFRALLREARISGLGVAIGHPYPETLDFLEFALPRLSQGNVELVPVSELLNRAQEKAPDDRDIDGRRDYGGPLKPMRYENKR